jgi:hypothetical protein
MHGGEWFGWVEGRAGAGHLAYIHKEVDGWKHVPFMIEFDSGATFPR